MNYPNQHLFSIEAHSLWWKHDIPKPFTEWFILGFRINIFTFLLDLLDLLVVILLIWSKKLCCFLFEDAAICFLGSWLDSFFRKDLRGKHTTLSFQRSAFCEVFLKGWGKDEVTFGDLIRHNDFIANISTISKTAKFTLRFVCHWAHRPVVSFGKMEH